jgi:hypothetical protein
MLRRRMDYRFERLLLRTLPSAYITMCDRSLLRCAVLDCEDDKALLGLA